jgi:hypothetical protein
MVSPPLLPHVPTDRRKRSFQIIETMPANRWLFYWSLKMEERNLATDVINLINAIHAKKLVANTAETALGKRLESAIINYGSSQKKKVISSNEDVQINKYFGG